MVHGNRAGVLTEVSPAEYYFEYDENYEGEAVSLTMPLNHKKYGYKSFPPFFEGLLPEGVMLEGLLKIAKIDKKDYHIDHIMPLSKGGRHTISNLVVSCPTCNLQKNAKDPYQFAQERGRLL